MMLEAEVSDLNCLRNDRRLDSTWRTGLREEIIFDKKLSNLVNQLDSSFKACYLAFNCPISNRNKGI